jgi:hypothetical protein
MRLTSNGVMGNKNYSLDLGLLSSIQKQLWYWSWDFHGKIGMFLFLIFFLIFQIFTAYTSDKAFIAFISNFKRPSTISENF